MSPSLSKMDICKVNLCLDLIFLFLVINNLAEIRSYQHTENHVIEGILSLGFTLSLREEYSY